VKCNNKDWISVVDGDGTVLLKRTCGVNNPADILSGTHRLHVEFHSEGNLIGGYGYEVEWEEMMKPVGP
jgi:hypothetical protein